jgi:hypothetical protein
VRQPQAQARAALVCLPGPANRDPASRCGSWLFEDIDTVNVRCLNEVEGMYRAAG